MPARSPSPFTVVVTYRAPEIRKAVAAYGKAVEDAPSHTAARNNLAQLLIQLKRYPEALVHLGRYEEALQHARRAVAIHPDHADAHYFVWVAARELGRLDEAALHLHRQAALRSSFDAHLEACPYCANYLEQMRETIDTLGRLSEESLSPDARDQLLEAFRGWAAGR